MTFEQFKALLSESAPADDLPPLLQVLWYEAKGNWQRAHELAQQDDSQNGAWVHAYLHRVEGDLANAGYWYRKAGRTPAKNPLREEWEQIARALLV